MQIKEAVEVVKEAIVEMEKREMLILRCTDDEGVDYTAEFVVSLAKALGLLECRETGKQVWDAAASVSPWPSLGVASLIELARVYREVCEAVGRELPKGWRDKLEELDTVLAKIEGQE